MPTQIMLLEFHNQEGPKILHQSSVLVNLNQQEILQYTFLSNLQIDNKNHYFSCTQRNMQGILHTIVTYRFSLPDAYQRALLRNMALILIVEEEIVKNKLQFVEKILQQVEYVLYSIFYSTYKKDLDFTQEILNIIKNLEEDTFNQITDGIQTYQNQKEQITQELDDLMQQLQEFEELDENLIQDDVKKIFYLNKTDLKSKNLEEQVNQVAKIQLEFNFNKNNISNELIQKLLFQCQIYRNTYLIYREYKDIMKQQQIDSIEMMLKLISQYFSLSLKNQLLTKYFNQSNQVFYMQRPIYCMLDEKSEIPEDVVYDIEKINLQFKPAFIYEFIINNPIVDKYNKQIKKFSINKNISVKVYNWFTSLRQKDKLNILVYIILFSMNNMKIFVQQETETSEFIEMLKLFRVSLEQNQKTYLSKVFETKSQVEQGLKLNKDLKIIRLGQQIKEGEIKDLINKKYGLFVNIKYDNHYKYLISNAVQISDKILKKSRIILEELMETQSSQQFENKLEQLFAEYIAINVEEVLSNC